MAQARIKRDMMVTVIAGENLGQSGKVLSVDRDAARVVVEGVNVRKKTVRRTPDNPQGGITEREAPIHISNVMPQDEYQARRKRHGGKAAAETAQQEDEE